MHLQNLCKAPNWTRSSQKVTDIFWAGITKKCQSFLASRRSKSLDLESLAGKRGASGYSVYGGGTIKALIIGASSPPGGLPLGLKSYLFLNTQTHISLGSPIRCTKASMVHFLPSKSMGY